MTFAPDVRFVLPRTRMRIRASARILSATIALSTLSTSAAFAATTSASVASECSRLEGRDRASCELRLTNGRPIRRQVKAKARGFIKAHVKITKKASQLKVHTVPVKH